MKKIISEIASGVQKTLDRFTSLLGNVKERVSKYVPSVKTPKASLYTGDKLTEIEKISYQCKTTYKGGIRHLFLFYPFIDLEEKPALADLCGFKSIPTAKVFSRVMDKERMGIEPFRELLYDLSETSRSLGLWKGRLVGLDGSLIKSNTSSYKNNLC